jgi:hypothetical protein
MPGGKALKGEWTSQRSSERRCRKTILAMWRNPKDSTATSLIVMNRGRRYGVELLCRLTDGVEKSQVKEKFLGDFWTRSR